jgi:hypothetical protein
MASASTGNLAITIAIQNIEDRDGDACVCGDRRTPERKGAGKQNAADGKDGRCSFRFEDGYYYKSERFALMEEMWWSGGRTVR